MLPPDPAKIFDSYFSTKQKGSGLVLTMAYSIITNHDGYMTVESRLGEGTTFYVYLPASLRKVKPKPKTPVEPQRGKGKILVMDDVTTFGKKPAASWPIWDSSWITPGTARRPSGPLLRASPLTR